ncbi:hypothetical protein BH23GEM6_BH23GEM6_00110 [soil metagenome]
MSPYDDWRYRPRRESFPDRAHQRGFRDGYDSIYQERYRSAAPREPRYGADYRSGRERPGQGSHPPQDGTPAYPPRHWGGTGPRERSYDRGYRVGENRPGRGPGGFFRGGF